MLGFKTSEDQFGRPALARTSRSPAKKGKLKTSEAAGRISHGSFYESHRTWIVCLVLACTIFFWEPLTSQNASIQWDAADYYYVVQKYFADELHAGRLPFWTPYVWSGYPFLADPQVGAWYPLNWPFFAVGVTPRTIQWENFFHSLIACLGAYALSFHLVRDKRAATLAGLCYGLCGWFVGHSSHTTMVESAAWLPWLLLCYLLWRTTQRRWYIVWSILISGLIILAGHFQTTLYSFLGLGLFAVALCIDKPKESAKLLSVALLIPAGGVILSAVHTLPGLELARQSMRATFSASTHTEGFLQPGTLFTLIYPNFYGIMSGQYSGPADITQYYLYAGLLLLPLACFGLRNRDVRWTGVLLAGFCGWYALGHHAGLYWLMARLPAFSSIRAPVNAWFVAALGLSLLASAGAAAVVKKWTAPSLPLPLLLFTFADVWYWNADRNPLLYARGNFDQLYGDKERLFESTVAPRLAPLTRFEAPEALASFGPMSHPLDTRIEASYGYGPLKLQRYLDFTTAMTRNAKLRDDLNISRFYAVRDQRVEMDENPSVLPRVNFPKRLIRTGSTEESKNALEQLNPHEAALVPAEAGQVQQDGAATAAVEESAAGEYRIRYQAASDSILRIGQACFPGWHARAGGKELPVFCVDHALTGLLVPAGQGEISFRYRPTYFAAGASISVLGVAACVAALAMSRRQRAVSNEAACD